MRTKAFRAWRPPVADVEKVACPPYDVVSADEARAFAEGNPRCFLRISRAELEFPVEADPYSDSVYARAAANFQAFKVAGWLRQDDQPGVFVYRQTMGNHSQTGVVCVCHAEDYDNDVIKKHEKTRQRTEEDRIRLTLELDANTGPVFLAYKDEPAIEAMMRETIEGSEPLYDIVVENDVRHTVWRAPDPDRLVQAFGAVPEAYIADGHHRAASGAKSAAKRRAENPAHTGEEEYNWFMAVLFPASHLHILPYNRVVKDLNGLSPRAFLDAVRERFAVSEKADPTPASPRQVSMFVDGRWWGLSWGPVESDDPVAVLDVSVLQDRLLSPVLGIADPRNDLRIEFVGGIRGTDELVRRVEKNGGGVAFSMVPVTIEQLMAISDANRIMPPKSTWFEPKLRSGLLVHTLD